MDSGNDNTFALLLNLFAGKFTLYDYSKLLPLFTQDAFSKVASHLPNNSFKMSDITANVDVHRKILSNMTIEQLKKDPSTYIPQELDEVMKKSEVTNENMKTLISTIVELRKAGPKLQSVLMNPELRDKMLKGDFNSILDTLKTVI